MERDAERVASPVRPRYNRGVSEAPCLHQHGGQETGRLAGIYRGRDSAEATARNAGVYRGRDSAEGKRRNAGDYRCREFVERKGLNAGVDRDQGPGTWSPESAKMNGAKKSEEPMKAVERVPDKPTCNNKVKKRIRVSEKR